MLRPGTPVFAQRLRPGTPVFAQRLRPGTHEFEKAITTDGTDDTDFFTTKNVRNTRNLTAVGRGSIRLRLAYGGQARIHWPQKGAKGGGQESRNTKRL